MDRVQLVFRGIAEVIGGEGIALLILSNLSGTRQVAIVCDSQSEYQVSMRTTKAPHLESLLPETLCRLMPRMNAKCYEIVFSSIHDGQYTALLTDKETDEAVPMRASDAVLLAIVAHLNVFMEQRLFTIQSVPVEAKNPRMSLPVNVLNDSMLAKALERAIASEDYEMASLLKQEMERRRK